MWPLRLQGRLLRAEDVQLVQRLRQEHPHWSRVQLSQHLACAWNWRNPAGQLKDMAARTLLLKLQRRGLIDLPPPLCRNNNARTPGVWASERLLDLGSIAQPLAQLLPLSLQLVQSKAQRQEVRTLLARYHYLGFGRAVGENVQYLIAEPGGATVAVMVFGAAAWKCAVRDQFIGWSALQRQSRLGLLANQQRFLIPPWVKVAHLGSHVLALATRRLCADWQQRYGHAVVLLESFVEEGRFSGAVYQAANWQCVGRSTGRSRQDRRRLLQVPRKAVWLYPLARNFRQILTRPLVPQGGGPCS